jgi:hypothetical protein
VSVSREPQRPLHTVIKETVPVIFHSRVGHAVKHCQRRDVRLLDPPYVQSCQSQAIPAEDGVTTRGSISSAMTRFLGKADLSRPKGRS